MRIGPYNYVLLAPEVAAHDGRTAYGLLDNNQLTISIAQNAAEQVRAQSLWHEIVHAIAWIGNLKLSESEVDVIAAGVYQVLRDNEMMRDLDSFDWSSISAASRSTDNDEQPT